MRTVRFLLSFFLLLGCGDDAVTSTGGGGHGGSGSSASVTSNGGGGAAGTGTATSTSDASTSTSSSTGGGPFDELEVVFPPSSSSIDDDDTLIVRGTVTPPSSVESVSVAGIPAESTDGFATWKASVPLALGMNTLAVSVVADGVGLPSVATLSVERKEPLFANPGVMALDKAGNRTFTLHPDTSILESNLTTGTARIVSSLVVGSGPPLDYDIQCLAWDAAGSRVLGVDDDELVAIDAATGARSVVTHDATGTGGWPNVPRACAVQPGANRVLVTDQIGTSIWAIDLATGNRSIVASNTVGTGKSLTNVYGIEVHEPSGRAFVGSDFDLLAVNLANGNRTIVSGQIVGGGPVVFAWWLTYDAVGARFFMGGLDRHIVAVDEATGLRTSLAKTGVGSGPELTTVSGIAWDGTRVLFSDAGLDGIIAADPSTLARSYASGFPIGSGPSLLGPERIGYVVGEERVVVWDPPYQSLVSIEVATGARTVISDNVSIGSGPPIVKPLDFDGTTAYGSGGQAIQRVNLLTGNRQTVSSNSIGSGPPFMNTAVTAIAHSANGQTLWVKEGGQILAVDVATGNRTLVADAVTGMGPSFSAANDLLFDGTRLLVILTDRVLSLDPTTGDRVVMSGPGVGTGPAFFAQEGFFDGGRLIVGGPPAVMTAIDLSSGDRTTLPIEPKGFAPSPPSRTTDGFGVIYSSDAALGALVATDTITGESVVLSK